MIIGILVGLIIAVVVALLWQRYASFVSQKLDHYQSGRPFDIRRDLNGPILSEGLIYGPLGRVSSRFVGNFSVNWDGDRAIMIERFRYDSGNTQDRRWDLVLHPDGRISAEAEDLVGTGHGRVAGSALVLHYRIRLTEDAGGHVLSVTDWIYTTPDGVLMNRSQFRKFGLKVAELVATMRPAGEY
ncbi:DUF3833 family protein [Marivivens aquimaris]|uniref:DUF3833 family protein n=1 Tax=Marivivens aquimaris TaxID=2774876 RepID=UPI001D169790|nr:DUF3833 family protein [Marivivens aquimaris]